MKKFVVVFGLIVVFVVVLQVYVVILIFVCDLVGQGFDECKKGVDVWVKKMGNIVKFVQVFKELDVCLVLYQQQFGVKVFDVDVYMIDVVWFGLIGQYLMDLSKFIFVVEVKVYFLVIVQNNIVGGKLIVMFWFIDVGVLYYCIDLLKKYGYNVFFKIWNELVIMVQKIQVGECKSNFKFVGYVFQGKNYEGLICDVFEWISFFGGGFIVDFSGKIIVNNFKVVQVFQVIQGLIGIVVFVVVIIYGEEEVCNVWQVGNLVFMCNWFYVYVVG